MSSDGSSLLQSMLPTPLLTLDEKVGRRFGFSTVRLGRDSIVLIGGASYFDTRLTDKPELDKFAAVPLSQLARLTVRKSEKREDKELVACDLLAVNESSATQTFPPNRCYHSSAVLAPAGDPVIVIFGGRLFDNSSTLSTKRCASLFCCDLKNGVRWYEPKTQSISASPSPRCDHACVSINSHTLLIHGGSGYDDASLLGDLWTLHLGSDMIVWTRLLIIGAAPSARKRHTLTAVSAREVVLFGGEDGEGRLNDCWLLQIAEDGTRAVWSELPAGPTRRAGHSSCLVTTRDILAPKSEVSRRLVVFGGAKSTACFDFETSQWTEAVCESDEAAAAELFAVPVPERLSPLAPTVLVLTGSPARNGHRTWMYSLAGFDPRDVRADGESRSAREQAYAEWQVNQDTPKPMHVEKVKVGDLFWAPSALLGCLEILGGEKFKHRRTGDFHFFDFPQEKDAHALDEILNGENALAPILAACACQWILFASKSTNGALTLTFLSYRLWLDAHSHRKHRVPVARFSRSGPELLTFLRLVRCYSPLTEAATAAEIAGLKRGTSVAIAGGFKNLQISAGLEIILGKKSATAVDLLPLFDFSAVKILLKNAVSDFKDFKATGLGHVCTGKFAENFGVLVYSHGRLIRRLNSRLPGPSAPGRISAIVDCTGLHPDRTRTDFADEGEWEQWVTRLCAAFEEHSI